MNELQVFSYEGNEVRTVQQGNETWWALKDVCNALGLADTNKVAERLDSDELTRIKFVSGGQNREMYAVNESGLYNVILRSEKPEAKKFKRWVTHEVLPTIRKHGAYLTTAKLEEVMNDPDAWIKMLTALKEERAAKERLQLQAEENYPKVVFADAVSVSDGTILIGELAKILKGNGIDIGQNRLFEKLRQDGYLIKRKGTDYNAPTQMAMNLGLFKVKETAITHSDGHVTISKTTKVTGKGQQYFVNLFLGRSVQE
jgi:anti-repressor protein